MMQIDMNFLFLGQSRLLGGENAQSESLFFSKNMQIVKEFKIHSSTVYLEKFIVNGNKMIISLGLDINKSNSLPHDKSMNQ
jgi:hypothetical protein